MMTASTTDHCHFLTFCLCGGTVNVNNEMSKCLDFDELMFLTD